ncbi:MAG: hypothetical protein QOK40_1844 [Miltoncostaeaceae bacterium]|nr:hypothetical protein [Miltoncostaeaceae bacterium]
MTRARALRIALVLAALLVAAPSWAAAAPVGRFAGDPVLVDGLMLPARVVGDGLALATGGGFEPRFWAGVNLGATVPGTQPGEVAATREDYDRWLAGMGALGVRVVRVYTILRPSFYDALAAYNGAHPGAPVRLLQGVWIPEERFTATGNAYDGEVTRVFRAEIGGAVAVVHGNADIPLLPGHAGGRYRSDVSRWLLAWSIGVEWDPAATQSTDRLNAGAPPYEGRYIRSLAGSTPMESWIASMLDHLAGLEAARGWSRPLTFTNWLTLDPLRHPEEPFPQEDLVSVDAMHLAATPDWPGGFFASYHAYPYYPDFLRLEPAYQAYQRPRDGLADPYAGYLHALRAHHQGQAVMITEFGVPSSLGLAHRGPLGRDQGAHSEREAAAIDADLLRDIRDEGFAGGVLFEWIDEWFKHTWNTTDQEIPSDRRQLWRNPLTNEEHFGVVAAEPGPAPPAVIDGRDDEWQRNGSRVIARSRGALREVRAAHDEEYLYLLLRLARPVGWAAGTLTIGLDVRPGGNRGLPGRPGVAPRSDVAVTVGPGRRARLVLAASTDPLLFQYGLANPFLPVRPADLRPGSGVWVPLRQILNRPYVVPSTGEQRPVEIADLSSLRWGTTDPRSRAFDDRNLLMGRGSVLELRLPWSMLGFSDPSSHLVAVPRTDGTIVARRVGRLGIAIAGPAAALTTTSGYGWAGWQSVRWHERRKAGWSVLASAFASAALAP